jgi:ERCC4-type nuclease
MKSARPTMIRDGAFVVPVAIDSREQLPFSFDSIVADEADGGGPVAVQWYRTGLKSGDYSLEGHTTRVAVERKSKSDLFGTLGSGRRRFEAELARLASFHAAAIVVESEWSELLADQPRRSMLPAKSIFRTVIAWQQRFQTVHWWFVPGRAMAEVTTFRILERYLKENGVDAK